MHFMVEVMPSVYGLCDLMSQVRGCVYSFQAAATFHGTVLLLKT